nr:hypothetical protein [Pseudarcicella sp.]
KPWRLLTKTFSPALTLADGKKIENYFDVFKNEVCLLDRQYKFETNGDFLLDQGKNKCFNDIPASIKGTWSFNLKQDVLSFSIPFVEANDVSDFEISNNGTFVHEYEEEFMRADSTTFNWKVRDTYTNK